MYTLKCPKCKKYYEFEGMTPKCCPECMLKERNEYKAVRAYVHENQGATIYQVAHETGVSPAKILQYLREELLEIASNSTFFLKCRKCGIIINTGVYCDSCKRTHGEGKLKEESGVTHENSFEKKDTNKK